VSGLQPFDPGALLIVALLNPAVILIGLFMGYAADQAQKLVVAGFAAALAGAALVWLAAFVRLLPARGMGGEAGLFVLQFVIGTAWAALGYAVRRIRK